VRHLWDRVRELKLDQVTIGYTVGGWAIIQAISLGASAFQWQPWILQTVIAVAVLGLPASLIGAWALALRESGHLIKPTKVDRQVLTILGALLGLAAILVVVVFWPGRHAASSNLAADQSTAPAASLAVLPFANLGGDESKRYISDGISDQLINALSKIPALSIAAQTSSFSFVGKHQDVKTIARALNVRMILEGSVFEDHGRIRIIAELIDAATGFQIWSDSFDRNLDDILAAQDSITRAITAALTQRLLGKAIASPSQPANAIDPATYRTFLLGRFYVQRDTQEDLRRAADLFKQVTLKAPKYAEGFAQYSHTLVSLETEYGDPAALVPAEQAAQRALVLDPKSILALRSLLAISLEKWDWLAAADYFRRARDINPNNSGVQHSQSILAAAFNYPEQDLEAEKKAADLDPLSFAEHFNLAIWYSQQGRYEEALKAQNAALQLQPTNMAGRDSKCSIEVEGNHLKDAEQLAASMASEYAASAYWLLGCPFDLAVAQGRLAGARKLLDRAAAGYSPSDGNATVFGNSYRRLGDLTTAMMWYERAYAARERDLLLVPTDRLQTRALLNDARWKALWSRQPIQDWLSARAAVGHILGVKTI
jgi:TolB-like protein/Tfp pilus assembly protein PilF